MSSKRFGRGGGHGGHPKKEKRPPLTHFLCLPLINSTSTPQLASSLAEFKEAIPLIPPPSQASSLKPPTRLVPDDALRPLGTLHFTLGVMSLPTEERLQEALEFLQSLDLRSILQDVEATLSAQGTETSTSKSTTQEAPQPLNISLKSLSALPSARNATILHARPSDPTSRLYPFSNRIRDKFIEAGFLLAESSRAKDDDKGTQNNEPEPGSSKGPDEKGEEASKPQNHGKKPRPLLLHATVANTIYMGRRRQAGGKRDSYKFDARDLLSKFRDYDGDKGASRGVNVAESRGINDEGDAQKEENPFIWARDLPLESLTICEMGAKDIPPGDEARRALLGQEYVAVGGRKLDFSQNSGP